MHSPKRPKLEPLTPVLPDDLTKELPLIDVYVGTIKDPRTISKIVVNLNTILPIPDLMHLKRVKGKKVLITPSNNTKTAEEVWDILKEKQFNCDYLAPKLELVQVAGIPPKVRKQYERVQKLWPCNFHSNPYWEKLSTNTLFTPEELQQHEKYMRAALDICEISGVRHSTLIVDPVSGAVVGAGFDQSKDCPTKHAVMVAVDNVAKTQKGGVWEPHGLDARIVETIEEKHGLKTGPGEAPDGPYLCTGFSVYTTREPCITCAMALVHSRAKRVFYGVGQTNGALGSLCKIHAVENLNHHYEVFAGLLESECGQL